VSIFSNLINVFRKQGFKITFESEYVLQGKPNEFGISYREGAKKAVFFKGKKVGNKYELDLDIPDGSGYGLYDTQGYNRKDMRDRILKFMKQNRIVLIERK